MGIQSRSHYLLTVGAAGAMIVALAGCGSGGSGGG